MHPPPSVGAVRYIVILYNVLRLPLTNNLILRSSPPLFVVNSNQPSSVNPVTN